MRVFVIGLLGVGVLAVAAYLLVASQIPSPTPGTATMVVATSTMQDETPAYSIQVTYPQFGFVAIDAQIKSSLEEALLEFKSLSLAPHDNRMPKSTLEGTFETAYIGPDIVSVVLILTEYTGGAHPGTELRGLNFDRTSGRRLSTEDALALVGKSLEDVSAETITQLRERLGEDFSPEGAAAHQENFNTFAVSKDSVTFIMQEYQVAAYAAGPQRVSFIRVK
jgi:Deacetylase PdaC/Protein of unknown function (DUF3298)